MITKQQAMTHHGKFMHMTAKDSTGAPVVCRTNGECKIWKTRPDDFKLPVKHGLRDCFYITPENAADWCTPKNYPVEKELFRK